MKGQSLSPRWLPGSAIRPTRLDRLARGAIMARLEHLVDGRLTLAEGGQTQVFGTRRSDAGLSATITIHDPRFFADVAFGGAIGAAEAYIRGYWQADDLTCVVRILLRNRPVLERMERGFARLAAPLARLAHRLNRNTRHGSRRNIAAHYDVGNPLFALMLDRSMMYSGAIFEPAHASLEEASAAKLERICAKLALGPGDRVVEIGSGWGGFALHAAGRYGCHVTTTTISREQYEFARQRVLDAGLGDRVTVLQQDYRDLSGEFDKLVSIEMIEAVGHEYYDTFFDVCRRLLAPHGLMCLQAITIADQRYDAARRSVDFIQRYIFPGGALPSVTTLAASMTRSSDLRVVHCEDIGPHYATTLRHWHNRFFASLDAVRKLGYSEQFVRMWKYYLCYCEGAFMERAIGNVQMLLARPANRRAPYSS